MRPSAERLGERALGACVPEKIFRLARMREAFEAVGLGCGLDLLGRGRARHQDGSASSRAFTAAHTAAATSASSALASMSTQRSGSAAAMAAKASRRLQ